MFDQPRALKLFEKSTNKDVSAEESCSTERVLAFNWSYFPNPLTGARRFVVFDDL